MMEPCPDSRSALWIGGESAVIEILGTLMAALGVGALSAWVPLVNAEAYVLALAATVSPVHGWSSVAGIAIGQTAGKQLMFAAARGGSRSGWFTGARWGECFGRRRARARSDADGGVDTEGGADTETAEDARPAREPRPVRRWLAEWGERGLLLLDRPWPAGGVVLAAASVGIPPLAVVSVAAGVRGTSGLLVAVCTLTGRTARFAAMAAPVIALRS